MNSAIHLEHLGKTYPRSWSRKPVAALKDMSLNVAEGEVFGFIGPNGAGKSTTIKILTGAMRQSSGWASLFGIPVSQAAARAGMGYVPENPQLYDFLTPLEILRMGMRLHRTQVDDVAKHCLYWLERFELAQVATKTLRTFSKGMTQRVALAHALAIKPRLLILDEPLSGLDPVGRRDVVEILYEFKKNGGTVFLTSHVLHDVERLADRFGLIHQGEMKMVKAPSDLVGGQQILTIRTIGTEQVSGMKSDDGRQWYGEAQSGTVWELLTRLESAGHQLIEVRPSLNLETAFMQYVQQA